MSELKGFDQKYRIPSPNEDLSKFVHGSHVFLYALTSNIALEIYNRKALVLMQLRFDGCFGFPGGLVDDGELPEEAVTRELKEEINYDAAKFGAVKKEDHISTHVDDSRSFVSHFFAKQLTEAQMNEVLIGSPLADEVGNESLGAIFVPLYTMKDSYRGLPAFLRNNFIGNAKWQLTDTLNKLNILTSNEINEALNANQVMHTNLHDV